MRLLILIIILFSPIFYSESFARNSFTNFGTTIVTDSSVVGSRFYQYFLFTGDGFFYALDQDGRESIYTFDSNSDGSFSKVNSLYLLNSSESSSTRSPYYHSLSDYFPSFLPYPGGQVCVPFDPFNNIGLLYEYTGSGESYHQINGALQRTVTVSDMNNLAYSDLSGSYCGGFFDGSEITDYGFEIYHSIQDALSGQSSDSVGDLSCDSGSVEQENLSLTFETEEGSDLYSCFEGCRVDMAGPSTIYDQSDGTSIIWPDDPLFTGEECVTEDNLQVRNIDDYEDDGTDDGGDGGTDDGGDGGTDDGTDLSGVESQLSEIKTSIETQTTSFSDSFSQASSEIVSAVSGISEGETTVQVDVEDGSQDVVDAISNQNSVDPSTVSGVESDINEIFSSGEQFESDRAAEAESEVSDRVSQVHDFADDSVLSPISFFWDGLDTGGAECPALNFDSNPVELFGETLISGSYSQHCDLLFDLRPALRSLMIIVASLASIRIFMEA